MARFVFWQGKRGSKGALALRRAIDEAGHRTFRIKSQNSRFIPRNSDIIINWGTSNVRYDDCGATVLNPARSIDICANKISFFRKMEANQVRELPMVVYNYDDAYELMESDPDMVMYCRTKVQGNSGSGIVVAHTKEELVQCNLYTVGIKDIQRELRVHVFRNRILSFAQKKRLSSEAREERGFEGTPDEEIRNLKGGWIFARSGVEVSEDILDRCKDVLQYLEMDFCALDIVEDTHGNFFFLEANTAPGLQGTTLTEYTEAIIGVAG